MSGTKDSEKVVEQRNKLIDIDNLLISKNPKLYKALPRFIINWLKRTIHQDEVNEIIWRNRDLYGLDFTEAVLREFNTKIKIENEHLIPSTGRYIIVSNHPLGGLDGVALLHSVGKIRSDIVFPVNDLLLNIKNFSPLFIPINKHGSNKQNIEILDENFASNKAILFFPAGLVSRKQKGVIKDLEWKKSIIGKAKKYKRDIIPAFIDGSNSNFFYSLANWRKRLRIKANIEMLFLVDEMFKQNNKTITITFGKSISHEVFGSEISEKEWAERLRETVYKLRGD